MPKRRLYILVAIILAVIAGAVALPTKGDEPGTVGQTSSTGKTGTETNQEQADSFDKRRYSLDNPTSLWVVVNKQRPLNPIDYTPGDLIAVGSGQQLRSEAAAALTSLISDARTAGYVLNPYSGYRSYTAQTSVYNREVRNFGQATADTQSARPGHSEHQTGWAIDFSIGTCAEDCFGTTPTATWVRDNAYRYGFIMRYVPGKEGITGYRHEPWHFRYVGTDLTTEMKRQGIGTLEEFFGLPAAPNY